ncbi:hypothetical protein [Phascolarctobacterium succinatutens]|uniref:hypothetical protein n=1 Tax=Phascolarctobacterium succinatutens TaxID=626940 RepID=UPI0023F2158A|nr:hypothetical protein [Phascolarctobacterium succinatutens]
MLEIILENIVTAPERLGLPAAYAESDVLLYRQYGRYDTVAVQREGRQLLKRVEALQAEYDIAALPRLGKQYAEWGKKLQQLKFKRLLHGECAAGKGITLYVNAIRQECDEHGWDYAVYYDSVLVHERVHLLHYQAVLAHFGAAGAAVQSAEYKQAQRYWYGRQMEAAQAAVVKETLAEFCPLAVLPAAGAFGAGAGIFADARGGADVHSVLSLCRSAGTVRVVCKVAAGGSAGV